MNKSSQSGWNRWALIITVLLTSLTTAIALVFLSATQLTERDTAEQFLARALDSLLEIDQFVLNAWPALEAAAAEGDPIPLTDFPIPLQLHPDGLSDGPQAVSDAIAAASASQIYDAGLDILADSPQTFRLISQGGAFDWMIGRLTQGGHAVAAIALIISGTLTILLALATAAQARGLGRIGAPALAIALGAALVWIAATVAQSIVEGRAAATPDPFESDLWLLAADAIALLIRNAAIIALAAAIVAALTAAASALLRVIPSPSGRGLG